MNYRKAGFLKQVYYFIKFRGYFEFGTVEEKIKDDKVRLLGKLKRKTSFNF